MRAGRTVTSFVLSLSLLASLGCGASSSASPDTTSTTAASGSPAPGRATLTVDDIPYYAGGPTLDAYLPDPRPDRPVPAVVLVHGGGWVGGVRGEWRPHAERMVREQGWAAFSIDYDLAATDPRAWPDEFHDVQAAVRFVAANASAFGIDATRIAVLGESAGGNLTALVSSIGTAQPLTGTPVGVTGAGQTVTGVNVRGATLSFPQPTLEVPIVAVGLWSAPTELAPLQPGAPGQPAPGCGANAACQFAWNGGDVAQYLGCLPSACPATYTAASPLDQVRPSTRPTFLSNSTDELVPLVQATGYAAALDAAGVQHQLKTVTGSLHALQTAPSVWVDTMAFLARYLDAP